jgi:hypothetical protein
MDFIKTNIFGIVFIIFILVLFLLNMLQNHFSAGYL